MGENPLLPFHCYFAKKIVQHTSFFPKFLCSIAGGTSDHSANGLGQQGNLLILQLFHGLKLIFIGKFKCLSPF
jgi:hypothetical protein